MSTTIDLSHEDRTVLLEALRNRLDTLLAAVEREQHAENRRELFRLVTEAQTLRDRLLTQTWHRAGVDTFVRGPGERVTVVCNDGIASVFDATAGSDDPPVAEADYDPADPSAESAAVSALLDGLGS